MTDEEIGNLLNRTAKSVRLRRNKLKLVRDKKIYKTIATSDSTKRTRLSFDEIKHLFEERGYELLSDETEYKNKSSKLRYICPKHRNYGELNISVSHFEHGEGCCYCGREKTNKSKKSKMTDGDDKRLCEIKGFEYIKTETINGRPYIYFICPKHKHLGIQKMQRGGMNRECVHGCQYCYGKNLPHWYVKKLIEQKFPNLEVLSEYQGMNKPLTCHCNKHNQTFTNKAKEIFYYGRGCSECKHENRSSWQMLSKDEVKRRILEANQNVEILNLEEYGGFEYPMKLKCKDCGTEWVQPFHSILANTCRCPGCQRKMPLGEEEVATCLIEQNQLFISQYKFNDCKLTKALPFDFAIVDEDENVLGLIEYQGKQHYQPIKYFGGEEHFEKQVKRDKIKLNYCKEHNIPLLIIPYWDFKYINELIINFIQQL